jgi:hypothetical protein
MFDLLFKSLADLNNYTALLEACNWDEDRVTYVLEIFRDEIDSSDVIKSGKITIDDLQKNLQKNLEGRLVESEILILSNILSEAYLNILKFKQENQYEN